jgi:hypothetical protein
MNNEFYNTYIDTITEKINILNNTLFNISIKVAPIINSSEPAKHRDDTMALQNLLWNQQVSIYRDTKKKINRNINYIPKEYTVIDSEEVLIESIKRDRYKTTWSRLDCYQKKEKIIEFIENKKNNIHEQTYKDIISSIETIIKKSTAKKIVYDNISSIQSIWCISYDIVTNTYSFHL